MKSKKGIIALALILIAVAAIFAGCTSTADNEDNTLQMTVMSTAAEQIISTLQEAFPDIDFDIDIYTGSNFSGYLKERLVRGEGGDIFFYTTFYNSNDADKYLVDLSGYPFLTNYDRAILSTLDINGAIYQIPGPITVRYIAVNKTLFEEKGWKIPSNFEEMVAVCKQIRREAPGIAPLGLGMASPGYIFTPVTSYAQMGYLDTAEGKQAEQDFRLGKASFGDVFGDGLDMVGELINAGAFMPEKFANNWEISAKQMGDRAAAMCYVMGSAAEYTQLFSGEAKGDPAFGEHGDDEFVVLPLFGRNAKNKGLILATTNTWGISKYLEEKGNEKKLKNALRVLEFISTMEGQMSIRYNPASIPALKELQSDDIPEFMRNLWNDSTNSIKSFFLYTGYEHIMIDTAQVVSDAIFAGNAEGMKEKFIQIADKINEEFLQGKLLSNSFGTVKEDLSVEQTRKVCCEALCAAADADLAIASETGVKGGTTNKYGFAGRLFKGAIIGESLNIIVGYKGVNVVTAALSGREIKEMTEKGKQLSNAEGIAESFTYWSGGNNYSIENGEPVLNGRELEDTALYKVAMLMGDYSEFFAAEHELTDTGIGILDALGSYFKSLGVIAADN